MDELPAPGTYSSQGESAEELKRLKEVERAVEGEVRTPALYEVRSQKRRSHLSFKTP